MSTREQKSAKKKQKLMKSAMKILKKYGYTHMTVRNICEGAGVTTGTFYHFYNSKDDLLIEQMRLLNTQSIPSDTTLSPMDYILTAYLNLTKNYEQMGIDFVSNYYSPHNRSFNIYTREPGGYLWDAVLPVITNAIEKKWIDDKLTIDVIFHDIRIMLFGNTFEWCASEGISTLTNNFERMLKNYLIQIFTPSYFEQYPMS